MGLIERIGRALDKAAFDKKYADVVFTVDVHGFSDPGLIPADHEFDPDFYTRVDTEPGQKQFKYVLVKLYRNVLKDDPNWHYFIEGRYNHIRFSWKFWNRIKKILDYYKAEYGNLEEWRDGQKYTRKYQHIFQEMFHTFSVLALQQYDENEIDHLLDRVVHCFINHQTLFLPEHVEKHGQMMEPLLIANNAAYRSAYIGKLAHHDVLYGQYVSKLDEYREKCMKAVHDVRESAIGILKTFEESDEPLTSEDIKEVREAIEKSWEREDK